MRFGAVSAAAFALLPILSACEGDDRGVVTITALSEFSPATINVRVGDTVTWKNRSTGIHSVTTSSTGQVSHTADKQAEALDSGDLLPGRSWSYRFRAPGRYLYFDSHGLQASTVGVVQVSPR